MNKMDVDSKRVSVIIPTYKRADMLTTAVDSILNQTYGNIEVLVVDDNNPTTEWRKHTSDIMKRYENDHRVHYILHECNKNGSAARNTGISNASGEFLCFLDDDDYFLDTKIEEQVNFLNNYTDYAACCCDYQKNKQRVILEAKDNYVADILALNRTPQTSGIMFRKSAIASLNGFDESYIRHQDYELLLRFFKHGYKMGKIEKVLYIREIAANDNTPDGLKMEQVKRKFLSQFEYLIDEIEASEKNFKKEVYVRHYFQLLKCFIKNKNIGKVFEYLKKMIFISPSIFVKELIRQYKIRRGKLLKIDK